MFFYPERTINVYTLMDGWMNATAIESIAEKQKIIDWDGQTDRRINELKNSEKLTRRNGDRST